MAPKIEPRDGWRTQRKEARFGALGVGGVGKKTINTALKNDNFK